MTGGNGQGPKHGEPPNEQAAREESPISKWFRAAAHTSTLWSGSWQFFVASVIGVLAWAFLGPMMGYSDTWQLIVNTPTTVLTYLLGILILFEANRQSKESKIVHDELLRAVRNARTELIRLDEMSDEQLEALQAELKHRADVEAAAASEQEASRRKPAA